MPVIFILGVNELVNNVENLEAEPEVNSRQIILLL